MNGLETGDGLQASLDKIKTIGKSLFRKKRRVSVGIDVGSTSVKVVELERKNKKIVLKNYAIAKSSEELIKPGTSGVISDVAASVVKKTLQEAGIKTDLANVSVPSFASLVTSIEVPPMPDNEIEQAIRLEAPKYIPVPLSEVVYGWQIVNDDLESPTQKEEAQEKSEGAGKSPVIKGGEQPKRKKRILVVAIMKDISAKYEQVFQKSGQTIDSLEIDSFSLVRSLIGNDKKCYIVIDVGYKVSNIMIVSNKNILINRTVDIAGDRITKVISQGMNIDETRAEQFKIQNGAGAGSSQGENVALQVLNVLASEIKRTTSVFKDTFPQIVPEGIILSGGGSKMKGLGAYLEKEVGLKTIIGNPLSKIAFPEKISNVIVDYSPYLSVAIGLAMLGFEDKE